MRRPRLSLPAAAAAAAAAPAAADDDDDMLLLFFSRFFSGRGPVLRYRYRRKTSLNLFKWLGTPRALQSNFRDSVPWSKGGAPPHTYEASVKTDSKYLEVLGFTYPETFGSPPHHGTRNLELS